MVGVKPSGSEVRMPGTCMYCIGTRLKPRERQIERVAVSAASISAGGAISNTW